MLTKEVLSQKFINFAVNECRGSSEFYEYLSLEISNDNDLLELCTHVNERQPVPNLLFGAVHFLLLKGIQHNLKEYYPSLVSNPKPIAGLIKYFKDFCFHHMQNIITILRTKRVQTNEVRRCAYLYPVFSYIFKKTKKPLALIELGTSAGLQLLWDKYSYSYDDNKVYGNIDIKMHITSKVIGDCTPFLLPTSPPVSNRIGIDLNIIDLNVVEEKLWLKALIWPEHKGKTFDV